MIGKSLQEQRASGGKPAGLAFQAANGRQPGGRSEFGLLPGGVDVGKEVGLHQGARERQLLQTISLDNIV
jgi:hypothetical protein